MMFSLPPWFLGFQLFYFWVSKWLYLSISCNPPRHLRPEWTRIVFPQTPRQSKRSIGHPNYCGKTPTWMDADSNSLKLVNVDSVRFASNYPTHFLPSGFNYLLCSAVWTMIPKDFHIFEPRWSPFRFFLIPGARAKVRLLFPWMEPVRMASGVTCSCQKVVKMLTCRWLVFWSTLKVESIASFHVWVTALENEVRPPKQFGNGERGRNTPSIPWCTTYFPRLILFYYTHKSPTHGGCCFRFYVSLLPVGSFWIFLVTFADPLMFVSQLAMEHFSLMSMIFSVSKKMVSFIARFVLREGIVYVDMPVNWGNQPCKKPPWLWLRSSTSFWRSPSYQSKDNP